MVNQDDKRNQILKVAFDFFLTTGYEATTVRMICKKAKIEPPTLYYHFGSKKGLFFAVVEKMLGDYQAIKQKNVIRNKITPEERLRAIYEYSVNYAMTHIKETKFYLRYTLFTPVELKKDIDNYMKETYENKKNLLRECLKEVCEIGEYKFDIDNAFVKFEALIDDSTFNVVFSNWRPAKEEVYEIFDIFYKLHYKGMLL
jgi:AcrR family transcriptional regulator